MKQSLANPQAFSSIAYEIDRICDRFEAAWLGDAPPSPEAFLKDAPPGTRTELLRELVAIDFAYRRKTGVEPTAAEYAARFPDDSIDWTALLAGERTSPDSTVCDTPQLRLSPQPNRPNPVESPARFEAVRRHAQGGLGEVYVARDHELERNVALKKVRHGFADAPEALRRFLAEAKITGRLEHPGIVPVYSLGTDASGRPYYAMRFIDGETLEATLSELHAQQLTRDAWSFELRKLLGRYLQACEAVDYAHSRGVIHRDLKPANIMLGPHGETIVVDWGLAKAVDASAKPEGDVAANEADARQTQMGTLIGTPVYMSPEQAAGKVDDIGPAADIYGLGGVLHSILTGRPPVAAETTPDALAQLRTGRLELADLNRRRIPKPLVSICRKALASNPVERYVSVRRLIDDVEAWLAGNKPTAHREAFGERVVRWARVHRTAVASLGVFAVVAVTALSIGLVILSREQKATEEQRVLAEARRLESDSALAREAEQRKRAEAARKTAEWTEYVSHIQAAKFAWDNHQAGPARAQLAATAPALRNWEYRYLKTRFDSGAKFIPDSAGQRFAIDPYRRRVAVATSGTSIKIVAVDGGRTLQTLTLPNAVIMRLTFSADGKQLAAALQDGRIALWNLGSNDTPRLWQTNQGGEIRIAFHRDGRRLISSAMTPSVRVWDVATTSETAQRGKLSTSGTGAMYRGDGDEIVITAGTSVTLWNSKTDTEICRITLASLAVAVDCSHDGKLLVVGGQDGTVRVWDLDERREIQVFSGHQGPVGCVQFSRDGRTIVSGGYDLTIRLWDRLTQRAYETLVGHELGISALGFLTDKDIVSADSKAGVRIWTDPLLIPRYFHIGNIARDVALADDGSMLVIPKARNVLIYDWSTWKSSHELVFDSTVYSIDALGDLGVLAVGCEDGSVHVVSATQHFNPIRLTGFKNYAGRVRLSRDGRYAAASADRELRVWRLAREPGRFVEAPELVVSQATLGHRDVCFGPDNQRLYVGVESSRLKVFETATGEVVDEWTIPRMLGTALAMNPDGRTLAVATWDDSIELWDVVEHRLISVLSGHAARIQSLAFSPDGSRLASGGSDRTVRIWAVADAQEVLCFGGHPGNINCVKFSGDGSSLAVVGYLGTAMIYRARQ